MNGLQHNTLHSNPIISVSLHSKTMLNKCFLSNNVALCFITTKSTTPKFNNPLLTFPISLRSFCTITATSESESESESNTHPFAVSYLINNFGFTHESALRSFNLKQVRFNNPDNPDSVITFFQNHGFSHENIRIIIKKAPWLLSSQPHKMLLPKFLFFLSNGASSSDIVALLTASPRILRWSLEKRIIPIFQLLNRFYKTNKDAIVHLIKYWATFTIYPYHHIVANINFMTDFGISDSVIARFVQSKPSLICSKDLVKSLEEIKGLGFDPSTTTFWYALLANNYTNKNKKRWDDRVDVFKKWGWSDQDIIRAFRCQPDVMFTSIEKINLVMSFWVNQLGWSSLALVIRPHIFNHSLENWTVPRGLVVQFLLMNGLRNKNASLVTPFRYSEKLFLQKFVFSFKEESDYLLKLYEGKNET